MKKCGKILSQILFYAGLLLIVAASAFFLLQKKSEQPMFFFDRCLLWVQTGSMQPTIPEKSYILAEKAQGTQLQVGDVIVFLCRDTTSPVYGNYVAHRVVQRDGDGYKTKGDSPLAQVDPWTVERADILAVYQKNLPAMTALGRLFATPMGMVAVLALFFAVCGFVFIPTVVKTLKTEPEAQLTGEEFDALVQKELRRLEEEGLDPRDEIGRGK